MKVLVTGAAGFIGSHLCEALVAEGHSVTGVDNFDPYYERGIKESNLLSCMDLKRFRFVELDLRDQPAALALVQQGWDAVVHLAGRGGVRRSIQEPRTYMEINVGATLNLLEGMREGGCGRLVFASTSSVYGAGDAPFREEASTDRPMAPYAATKKACEVLCHAYHHLHGLDVFALRFFTVYGPRQRPDMAIHKFVKAICRREPLTRHGDGSMERDFTYVSDIVAGVVRAVERARGYEIINIGGAHTTSVSRLIEMLENLLGERARIVEQPVPAGDVPRTQADTSKAERLLDFAPTVDLEDGLRRFIAWYHAEQIP